MNIDNNDLRPNFTMVPNIMFDEWQSELSPAAFSCLMVVSRKTYGWQKRMDEIAQSQFEALTGMSKNTVKAALAELLKKNILKVESDPTKRTATKYSLNIQVDLRGSESDSREGQNLTVSEGQNLTVQKKVNKDKESIAAIDFIKSPFGQEKKKTKIRKPIKTLNIPEIESLLNIMEKTGIKMSTISANLKMQMLHAVELHGLEFCESALRGRVIQAEQQGKPLYLPTLFDPENGQWLNDCANIFEAQEKKVIVLHSMTDPDIDNLMSEMQAQWKAQ